MATEVIDTKKKNGNAPSLNANKADKNPASDFAVFLAETPEQIETLAISRPLYSAGKSKGPARGFALGIAGPFAPKKDAKPEMKKPWAAYVFRATAPTDCIGGDGNHVTVQVGEEFMIAAGPHLRNLVNVILDPKECIDFELSSPTPPPPGGMRVWKGRVMRRVDRDNGKIALPVMRMLPVADQAPFALLGSGGETPEGEIEEEDVGGEIVTD